MAERWRIVIVSTALPPVLGIHALCQANGHEPVALVTARPAAGGSFEAERARRFADLVAGAPPDLDLCVASDKASLAPLIAAREPDLLLCAGFGWKLPPDALAVPRLGCVNSHPSLLPKYRGPFPVGWVVRNGDTELGLTFHRMDADFDTGSILAQGSVPFGDDDWAMDDLTPRLAALASELLPQAFERIAAGDLGDAQMDEEASYAPYFEDGYVYVDWTRPAAEIQRQVRAWSFMFSRPGEVRGAIAELEGERVRLVRTSLVERDDAVAKVECGDGPLWILAHEPADAG